jgi:hypothetical protein
MDDRQLREARDLRRRSGSDRSARLLGPEPGATETGKDDGHADGRQPA